MIEKITFKKSLPFEEVKNIASKYDITIMSYISNNELLHDDEMIDEIIAVGENEEIQKIKDNY